MAQEMSTQDLKKELKAIRTDLDFIKRHMFDPDCVMTSEETKHFEEALKEYEKGKTTSLADVKKELGL